MTQDQFNDSYDAMVDAAYDGLMVCVSPTDAGEENLGVVVMQLPKYAEGVAYSDDDNERLLFGAHMIYKCRAIAEQMAASGIRTFDGMDDEDAEA